MQLNSQTLCDVTQVLAYRETTEAYISAAHKFAARVNAKKTTEDGRTVET
jgi:hypothetical protein